MSGGEAFWTIANKKRGDVPRDHISGFSMHVALVKGTKLDLRFERDTKKALRFNDLPAAETALNALRLFMRGGMREYEILEHKETE